MSKVKDEYKKFTLKIQKDTNSKFDKVRENIETLESANDQNEYQLDKQKQQLNEQYKEFEQLKFKVDETHGEKHKEID